MDFRAARCEDEGGHEERERRVEGLYDILALAPYAEDMPMLVIGIVGRVPGNDDSAHDVEGKGGSGKEWQE